MCHWACVLLEANKIWPWIWFPKPSCMYCSLSIITIGLPLSASLMTISHLCERWVTNWETEPAPVWLFHWHFQNSCQKNKNQKPPLAKLGEGEPDPTWQKTAGPWRNLKSAQKKKSSAFFLKMTQISQYGPLSKGLTECDGTNDKPLSNSWNCAGDNLKTWVKLMTKLFKRGPCTEGPVYSNFKCPSQCLNVVSTVAAFQWILSASVMKDSHGSRRML